MQKENLKNVLIRPNDTESLKKIIQIYKEAGYSTHWAQGVINHRGYLNFWWGVKDNGSLNCWSVPLWGLNNYPSLEAYEKKQITYSVEHLPEMFAVKVGDNEIARLVQERFFENGYNWKKDRIESIPPSVNYITILKSDNYLHWVGKKEWLDSNLIPIVPLKDFFRLPFAAKDKEVKLGDYTFKIGKKITVSGRAAAGVEIDRRVIRDILAALEKQKGQKFLPESFYVATPKITYLYVNNKIADLNYGHKITMRFQYEFPYYSYSALTTPEDYKEVTLEEIPDFSPAIDVSGPWPIKVAGPVIFVGCKQFKTEDFVKIAAEFNL